MPSLFVALQCCQCSTMQVKQHKKSSNKWTCVVCNEKQSVRKVFAQGSMAKDLRFYVQSFNMSRKTADDQRVDLDGDTVQQRISDPGKKRRMDWSEFLEVEDGIDEDEPELEIVTELPSEMFKKPKLKGNSVVSDGGGGSGLFKPLFSKRNFNKQVVGKANALKTSKGSDDNYKTEDRQEPKSCEPKLVAKRVSKWNRYMTEDDHDNLPRRGDHVELADVSAPAQWGSNGSSTDIVEAIASNDHIVDEDIHPDFRSMLF